MRVAISQSNYIPWKGYFDLIRAVDRFILYDDVQFTKRDWRSRNRIKTRDGVLWLTIPVRVKGKYNQRIRDVEISDPYWAQRHWKTIALNYASALHFGDFSKLIQDLYVQAGKLSFLSEVNYLFLKHICDLLEIKTVLEQSSNFAITSGRTERLVDLCRQLGATDYYTGPAAKAYLDEELFFRENINVHYLDYSGYAPYHQLHGDFVHEVSIVDLLLNEGWNASRYLKSFAPV